MIESGWDVAAKRFAAAAVRKGASQRMPVKDLANEFGSELRRARARAQARARARAWVALGTAKQERIEETELYVGAS